MLIPARSRIFPSLATETFVLVYKAYVPPRTSIRGHISTSVDWSVGLSIMQMLRKPNATDFWRPFSRQLFFIPTFIFIS